MYNPKTSFFGVVAALLISFPVQADFILTANYSDWTQTGPLSLGLVLMPEEFNATFLIKTPFPEPTPPSGPVGTPIPYPNTSWTAADVLSADVTFGDATWTTLASFDFEIDDGELYLDYRFNSLATTQTTRNSIVLNAPLEISGIDLASNEAFTYGYGTRILSIEQIPEPHILVLFTLGLIGIPATRRKNI